MKIKALKSVRLWAIWLFGLLCTPHALSAALIVDDAGNLLGASGVLVNGQYYDVAFKGGTCLEVFSVCAASSFAFESDAQAATAGLALLDQVFLDSPLGNFDSQPELTSGCWVFCEILIPYGFGVTPYSNGEDWVLARMVLNSDDSPGGLAFDEYDKLTGWTELSPNFDTNEVRFHTYSIWSPTPVPLPSALIFFLSAITTTGLAIRTRRSPTILN